jgi:pimeloyl-ACP methyl ester carboxylesterase
MVAKAVARTGRAGEGGGGMTRLTESFVQVAGGACRIIEGGDGPRVGVMPGYGGLPRWNTFTETLARSRRVVLVSLPGFPGSGQQYEQFDDHLDWVSATFDLLDAADLQGCDLVASSVAGVVAWEVAALNPTFVRRLSMAAPYGLFDVEDPITDIFARTGPETAALLSRNLEHYTKSFGDPAEFDQILDWRMMNYRAASAAARLVWPFGDRGVAKRLHRIWAPVQLLWGADDAIVPLSYADRYLLGLTGQATKVVIEDAGHLVWIDQPEASARAVLAFLEQALESPGREPTLVN